MGPVAGPRSAEHATGRMGRIRARATMRRIMARRPSGGYRTPREDRQRRGYVCRVARPASTVTSHMLAMPRPFPAPWLVPFRLASHAARGAARHGRARPVPGQSEFAPCRRQPPIDIHILAFPAGCRTGGEGRASARRCEGHTSDHAPERRPSLSAEKKPSTALIQEAEVGVKWKTHRGCRSSQARTLGCLWVA